MKRWSEENSDDVFIESYKFIHENEMKWELYVIIECARARARLHEI